MKAVYPGSFDPITYGHIDIIRRAAKVFDRLVIGVLDNVNKQPLFSVQERIDMIREETADIKNVEVKAFDGFAVEFAKENGAGVIVRGLRGEADFSYELQLSQINRTLEKEVDTVFFGTDLQYGIVSSSGAKEIALHGGNVSGFVPPAVCSRLEEKFNRKQEKKQ